MREKTLLLHGWGGSDEPHWQAWLAGEIAKDYGMVAFPLLENPHFPTKNILSNYQSLQPGKNDQKQMEGQEIRSLL